MHSHIFCLLEFNSEPVHSPSDEFSNTVADSRESGAKHLLLSLSIFQRFGFIILCMIAELWDDPLRPSIGFQQVQRGLNLGRVDVSFLTFQNSRLKNGEGFEDSH